MSDKHQLLLEKHVDFIVNYGKTHDKYEFEMSDFLRMSGLYWSLTFLDLANSADKLNKDEIVQFLKRNQHVSGGFGPCDGHDAHLLYSLSALQVKKKINYDWFFKLQRVIRDLKKNLFITYFYSIDKIRRQSKYIHLINLY